jgi:hypothetical protein
MSNALQNTRMLNQQIGAGSDTPELDLETMTEDERREQIEERLQSLGNTISQKRGEAVRARLASGVESRWRDDMDHYNGIDPLLKQNQNLTDVALNNTVGARRRTQAAVQRSKVFVNITRPRTNTAEARLADMLLPSDDRNWGIAPVKVPELAKHIDNQSPIQGPPIEDPMTGQPRQPTIADSVHAEFEKASKTANLMADEIEAQHTECDYNGELRKTIHDAAVLGTGVLKGPIVVNRQNRSWRSLDGGDGMHVQVMEISSDLRPASIRVDPWNFFPDPSCGNDVHSGGYVFEREYMTKRQLRELAKNPTYMASQIRKVLEEGPKSIHLYDQHETDKRDKSGISIMTDNRYEVWTYCGEVDRDDLEAAGVEFPEEGMDVLDSVSGYVIVVNNTVIKANLNPLETGEFPYDVFVWEKNDAHWTGYGEPFLLKTSQRVLNAAWRQVMDNAGLSAGPQIVCKREAIEPADSSWEITGRKLWWASDEVEDVRFAFTLFEVSSHLKEFQEIIELTLRFIDEESMIPKIAPGEQDQGQEETLGGMIIRANAQNVILRRLVKQFDDMITRPHIRRYYDWNMMYNPRDEIKGNFEISARGSSALLVKDQQNEALVRMLGLGGNPVYGYMLKTSELLRKTLQGQRIDPDEVVKDQQEIDKIEAQMQQNRQQGMTGSPDAQVRAQAAVQVAKLRSDADLQAVSIEKQQVNDELQARKEQHQADRDYRIQELLIQRDIEAMKLSAQTKMSLDQIKAKLADTVIKERTKKEIFSARKVHDRLEQATMPTNTIEPVQ